MYCHVGTLHWQTALLRRYRTDSSALLTVHPPCVGCRWVSSRRTCKQRCDTLISASKEGPGASANMEQQEHETVSDAAASTDAVECAKDRLRRAEEIVAIVQFLHSMGE